MDIPKRETEKYDDILPVGSFPDQNRKSLETYEKHLDKISTIVYEHHTGDISLKRIIPLKMYWGVSDTHYEAQWFLSVYEPDNKSELVLSMKNILKWK